MENEKFKKCVDKVLRYRDCFSMNELFNHNYNNINAVTVITPTQTVSRFNGTFKGKFGSGLHGKNFQTILYGIYGKTFLYEYSGQDICIGYWNKDGNNALIFICTPEQINNSQLQSLIYLDKELKIIESKGTHLDIFWKVGEQSQGQIKHMSDIYENNNDSESILKITDDISLKYPEILQLGYPNEENHYNNSEFIINDNSKVK